MSMEFNVLVGVRTVSESNVRSHWAARARRTRQARTVVAMLLRGQCGWRAMLAEERALVRLTRVHASRSRGLDDDNLRSALKAVRDGVADALGVDDRDPRLSFHYHQRPGLQFEVEVGVTIIRKRSTRGNRAKGIPAPATGVM